MRNTATVAPVNPVRKMGSVTLIAKGQADAFVSARIADLTGEKNAKVWVGKRGGFLHVYEATAANAVPMGAGQHNAFIIGRSLPAVLKCMVSEYPTVRWYGKRQLAPVIETLATLGYRLRDNLDGHSVLQTMPAIAAPKDAAKTASAPSRKRATKATGGKASASRALAIVPGALPAPNSSEDIAS